MKKKDQMRDEYDFSQGVRGKHRGIKFITIGSGSTKKSSARTANCDFEEINLLFHRLWRKAEGQEDYKRSEWTKLEKLLNKNNIPV